MTRDKIAKLVLFTIVVVIVGACNPNKTVTNNPTTPVVQPPTIAYFSPQPASITLGATTLLTWSVSNATSASIAPGVGAVTANEGYNFVSVRPADTTTYTLTVSNSGGTINATTSVTVKIPITSISYADPTSGTYRLLKNSAKSTSTHLVLDLVGPAGTLSGVGFCLSSDPTKVDWGLVDSSDSERTKNYVFSNTLIKTKVTTDGVLQAGIYQKGTASAVSVTSNTVLASVALDLKSNATISNPKTITFGAVSGKAVILNAPASGPTTSAISIATGTLSGN